MSLLDIALDHLTLGRAALYAAILENPRAPKLRTSEVESTPPWPASAAPATQDHHSPRPPHPRLAARSHRTRNGPESAQADLDEAWEIAERGPMPLLLADIHLYRARLFHAVTPYPWEGQSPR